MRGRNKPWADAYIQNHSSFFFEATKLPKNQEVYLEIGMGKGDFILQSSQYYPNVYHIGVEINKSVFAMALKKIVESETKNVAVLQIPASQLLDFIKTGSIDKIFLNFSDPWPKKRYHKRRLVHPNHLTIFEQCLKKSGQIVLKTDNQELYFYALEMFQQRNYQLLEVNPNYQLCEGDFMSEYEKRFRSLNQPIYRIVAKIN